VEIRIQPLFKADSAEDRNPLLTVSATHRVAVAVSRSWLRGWIGISSSNAPTQRSDSRILHGQQ